MRRWVLGVLFAGSLAGAFAVATFTPSPKPSIALEPVATAAAPEQPSPAQPADTPPAPNQAAEAADPPRATTRETISVPILGEDGRPDLDAIRAAIHSLITRERFAEADRMLWWLWRHGDDYAENGDGFQFLIAHQWGVLAERYPPAAVSLGLARNHSLGQWTVNRQHEALLEVITINGALGQTERTVDLMRRFQEEDAEGAGFLFTFALADVIEAEAFDLVSAQVPDADAWRADAEAELTQRLADSETIHAGFLGDGAPSLREFRLTILGYTANRVDMVAQGLRGAGRSDDTAALEAGWRAYGEQLPYGLTFEAAQDADAAGG